MNVLVISSLFVISFAIILHIIGLAIPYWTYVKIGDISSYHGLWKACGSGGGTSVCATIKGDGLDSEFEATRAFVLLGLFAAIGSLGAYVVRLFILKDKLILIKVAAALAIAAGILMLIAVIIYGATYDSNLHAGFGLVIVAAILSFVAGGLMFASPAE